MAYLKKPGSYPRKTFGSRPPFGAKRDFKSAERFQATCNECKKVCEVPFRPNGKKPVYCSNCYKGKEESPSMSPRSSYQSRERETPDFAKRLDAIDAKLDRILKSLG